MPPKRPSLRRLAVGDRVQVTFPARVVIGTVVEDRGDIGLDGSQVVRIELPLSDAEGATQLDISAKGLKLATAAA